MLIQISIKDYFEEIFHSCNECGEKCQFSTPIIMSLCPYGIYVGDVVFKTCKKPIIV